MQGDANDVYIDVTLSEVNMNIAKQEGLEKKFKLTTTFGTTNMHLFDSDGKIRKYDTPEQSMYTVSIVPFSIPSILSSFINLNSFFFLSQYLRSSFI